MIGTVVTTKGRTLMAKMVAMEGGISFTRAAVGTREDYWGILQPGDCQYHVPDCKQGCGGRIRHYGGGPVRR